MCQCEVEVSACVDNSIVCEVLAALRRHSQPRQALEDEEKRERPQAEAEKPSALNSEPAEVSSDQKEKKNKEKKKKKSKERQQAAVSSPSSSSATGRPRSSDSPVCILGLNNSVPVVSDAPHDLLFLWTPPDVDQWYSPH
jgi:hypothetical protein